jgi:DNA topoisomerase-2
MVLDKNKIQSKSIEDLFNKELVDFYAADNYRSIPHVADGLKPSQRKILYTCLMKKYTDIKVSQLAGAVSEFTAYHQGEASLNAAIVSMCQNFVGSNNIELLIPDGQFGTRLVGGTDSASPRYIHTYLNPLTGYIYREEDLPILEYLEDDGKKIEPIYFLPVIPMLLVNGSEGIGTGWSTKIPQYNPLKIISWIERKLNGTASPRFNEPLWFRGFNGEIGDGYSRGVLEIVSSSKVRITELPIKVWTEKYCQFLDELQTNNKIKNYVNYSTDSEVNIEVNFTREDLSSHTKDTLIQLLKLEGKLTYNNMNTLSEKGISDWDSVSSILNAWYSIRYDGYVKRKAYVISKKERELSILEGKKKFIEYVIVGKIKVSGEKKTNIESKLLSLGFEMVDGNYQYLLSMPIYHLTSEKAEELFQQFRNQSDELNTYKTSTVEDIWASDLKELKEKLKKAGY